MSSKILQPGDPRVVSPLAFRPARQFEEAKKEEERKAAGIPPPDFDERLAELERQCEQRVREAKAAGAREGEAAGRSRAAAELQPVIERLARSIEEISQMRARLRKEAEADMVKLALAIARRVLRREMAIDPEALHGLILAALEKLQGQEICRVRIHPAHAGMVTACLRQSVTGSRVEVIPDLSRQPGGVIFETDRGNLDASVDSQLQEIERGLTDCLQKHS